MLHLIFTSPLDTAILDRMAQGDAAVFMESAVLAVLKNGQCADTLIKQQEQSRFYVLSEDMDVRGIQKDEIIPGLEVINHSGLVQLTVEHSPIQSWC
ncbi:MAG: sulfurtransferase complex subunit TusB [Gammaproteobacteria bacterium]|nr:sulfurtransferase complex subunit TusB [Gammaproteobacteria bacterium]